MESGLFLKLFMLAIWSIFIIFLAKDYVYGLVSINWPKINGVITNSGIDAKYGGNGLTFYSPVIEYKYSINGEEFKNNKFTYMGTVGLTHKYASKCISKYPVNSCVEIYYHPKDRAESVIIPGVHWFQYVGFAFITIMFLSIAFIVEILNFIWPGCQPNCT